MIAIGTKVVCNRPSQEGNSLKHGVVASFTHDGVWVRVDSVEHWFPTWSVREAR